MSDTKNLTSLGSSKTTYDFSGPDIKILETFAYDKGRASQIVGFKTDEFTSLCPMTSQPDFASIDIAYIPNKLGVESKSLKLYLFSFRNHGSFHEDCINQIAEDLIEKLDPKWLRVVGDFTKRGGIAIKPISEYVAEGYERPTSLIEQYDNYPYSRQ